MYNFVLYIENMMGRRLAINREDLIDREGMSQEELNAIVEGFFQCLDDCITPEIQNCLNEAGCPDASDNWDGCDWTTAGGCHDKDCDCACDKLLPAQWLSCDCSVEGDCQVLG